MSLSDLPDDILKKIFCCLTDPIDYLNLTLTCKRINDLENGVKTFDANFWADRSILKYNLYPDDDRTRADSLGICTGADFCTQAASDNYKVKAPAQEIESFYYQKILALLAAKHRSFSTLKFKEAICCKFDFAAPINDAVRNNKSLAMTRLGSIIELELLDCSIDLGWLSKIMSQIESVKVLTINKCLFIDQDAMGYSDHVKRTLKHLRILGDKSYRISDSIFMYFAVHYPAKVLDISGTRVVFHKRIIKRFYQDEISNFDEVSPSQYILSFPVILHYLRRNRSIINLFIAKNINMPDESREKLLLDQELKRIKFSLDQTKLITCF